LAALKRDALAGFGLHVAIEVREDSNAECPDSASRPAFAFAKLPIEDFELFYVDCFGNYNIEMKDAAMAARFRGLSTELDFQWH